MEMRLRDRETVRNCQPADLESVARFEAGFRLVISSRSPPAVRLHLAQCGGRLTVSLTAPDAGGGEPALAALAADLGLEDARCLALAFSGGGFRATLFHLGVVRFLADIGKLQDVTHICSVSGGSILAAHLVHNWWRYTGGEFDAAAEEIIRLVRSDLRGRIFRRWIMSGLLFPLARLTGGPERWCRTMLLRREYDGQLFHGAVLRSLDTQNDPCTQYPRPELHILATAMKTGQMCSFGSDGLRMDEELGADADLHSGQLVGGELLPISLAVAASSAFPPVFPPVNVTHERLLVDARRFPQSPEYLSDGGVYDNLGIRKLKQLQSGAHLGIAGMLVSDAEAPFVWQVGIAFRSFWRRAVRSSDILMRRVSELEYALASGQSGTIGTRLLRCSISEVTSGPDALEPALVRGTRQIRTDLDRFSGLEIECLVKHGYLVARKALENSHVLPDEQQQQLRERDLPPWNPLQRESGAAQADTGPGTAGALSNVVEQVAELDRNQRSVRRWLPVIFDPRDWAAWVSLGTVLCYVLLVLAAVAIPTWRAEQWKSGFLVHTKTFKERWYCQFRYRDQNAVDQLVDLQVLELAGLDKQAQRVLPAEEREQVDRYNGLKTVAGEATRPVPAYLSRNDIVYDPEKNKLFSGYVENFQFPKSDDKLLLEFFGRAPSAEPSELQLEFQQYSLLGESNDHVRVVIFTVTFRKHGTDDYEGNVAHPVLKDRSGKPLEFATMRLWKPAEPDG